MEYWIEAEGVGHLFFYSFPICLLILFVLLRGRRVRFLISSLIITAVLVNPVFYKYWDKLGLYAYWRVLWIVPVIPVIAGLIPAVTERIGTIAIQKPWMGSLGKFIITAVGIIGVALGGTFVYNTARGQFDALSVNNSKLPGYVVEITDRLLELKDRPRVICQDPIGVYIRQYTGEIDSLFGRNITGVYISTASRDAVKVNNTLNNSEDDLSSVSQFMLDDGYDFLVMRGSQEINGLFEQIDDIDGYGIYRPIGIATVFKKRNELDQVTSVTMINENGNPVNNAAGYSTILYEYDEDGFISCEFHVDENGMAIVDYKGIAGFEWKHNSSGETIMERTIGYDGEPIVAHQNYAEIRWEYKDGHIVRESYFDSYGNPAVQAAGYVAVTQEWDGEKLISRAYLGTDGKPMNRIDGYAKADWSAGDVVFYDVDGNLVPVEGINLFEDIKADIDGWSDWMTPTPNENNCCFRIGMINLGSKMTGDDYSCQLEIEFRDVSISEGLPFSFHCQGSADGKWDIGNVWNYCANLTEAPDDGVYKFMQTMTITDKMADAESFEIAFRCDYWKSGSFRVRRVKIAKNQQPSEWTPGI